MKPVVYFTDNFLIQYKTRLNDLSDLYLGGNKEKINQIFEESEQFKDTGVKFKYKKLLTKENCNLGDEERTRENIKTIYSSLKHLTPTQAKDERLWAAMYNKYYLDSLLEYADNKKLSDKFLQNLKSEIFFTHGIKRSLIVQGISKLWWLGYYLYDDKHDNPYHLIDFFTESDITGKSTAYFSSSIVSNKNISFGIIEGIKSSVSFGYITNKRIYYTEILKYLNIKGAIIVLDIYTREEIKEIVIRFFRDYSNSKDA